MKVCCTHLITLSCMMKFQNYMVKHCVADKDDVASLKVKVTTQTFAIDRP